MNKRTLTVATITILAVVVCLGIVLRRRSNGSFIARTCAELNSKVPMHIDPTIDVVRVDPIGGTGIRFNYVFASSVRQMATKDLVHEQLVPRYTDGYKTDPTLKEARDRGIVFVYHFAHADGTFITEFEVDPRRF